MSIQEIDLNEFIDLFSRTIGSGFNRRQVPLQHSFPVELVETNTQITVYAEVPGVNTDAISIDFYNNNMTIDIVKECPHDNPINNSEIKYGSFHRIVRLPICVTQQETVNVSLKNGVLTIVINKQVEERNRFRVSVPAQQ